MKADVNANPLFILRIACQKSASEINVRNPLIVNIQGQLLSETQPSDGSSVVEDELRHHSTFLPGSLNA